MTLARLKAEYYAPRVRGSRRDNMLELAALFKEAVDTCGSQQKVARETGIAPGTVHHYISLLELPDELKEAVASGKIGLKIARCLADLPHGGKRSDFRAFRPEETFPREDMLALAQPFLDKRLSSVYAEPYVMLAKRHTQLDADALVELVLHGEEPEPVETEEPEPPMVFVPAEPPEKTVEDIECDALRLAGEMERLLMRDVPEYKRLKLLSTLRVLDSRLKNAIRSIGELRP